MKKKIRYAVKPRKSEDNTAAENSVSGKNELPEAVPFLDLYRYSTCVDKIYILLGVVFAIGTGICNPFMMALFGVAAGYFVDFATTYQKNNVTDLELEQAKSDLMEGLQSFAIEAAVLGFVTVLFSYISTLLFNISAQKQVYKMRTSYFAKVLNQDISWFDQNQTGDFVIRIAEDLMKIEEGIGEKASIFLFYFSTFVAGDVFALILGWELALICLISFPLSSLSMAFITWLTTKFTKNEMESYGAAGAIAEEVFGGIRTVVAFQGQQKEYKRYKEHLRAAQKNNIKRSVFTGISNGIMWFCIYSLMALSFWYGVKLVVDDRHLPIEKQAYNATNMLAIFCAVLTATWYFGQCSPYFEIFGIARGAAYKIFQIIDNVPSINQSKKNGLKPFKVKGNITFSKVYFEYPSRPEVKILKSLDLTIKAGETVALVGGSGCGKSTCVQLIQRFYDPSLGSVLLDGNDLVDLDLTWLREHIGVVGQEPVLFATTIAENIRYGHKTASFDDIKKAAEKANAHSFIDTLPEGYNTLVGERGAQLSGGQKQRIAIARALVREPAILLLDEATSALDTNSESIVQAALDSASEDRTTIIVAHRLSTIRNADRIVVLSEGTIAEEGNHETLMTIKGLYYNLVTRQTNTVENDDDDDDEEEDDDDSQKTQNVAKVTQEFHNISLEHRDSTPEMGKVAEEPEKEVEKESGALIEVLKLNEPEWPHIAIGCLASIVTGAALPIYSIIFGNVVGILAQIDDDYVREQSYNFSLYMFILAVSTGIASFLQMHMFNIAGEKLTMRVRSLLFETMLKQDMGWFDKKENGVGALCTRLSVDTAHIQGASGQPIGTFMNTISTLGLAIGFSLYFEWRISLVTLCFVPFIFLSIYLEQKVLQKSAGGSSQPLEDSSKIAVEAIGNVRTVASLGCEDMFLKMYEAQLQTHYQKNSGANHFRGFALGMARGLLFFSYGASLYYGGTLVKDEHLDYGDVFKVSEALITGAWSMGNAVAFTPNFQKGLLASGKIFKLLNRTPTIRDSRYSSILKWENGKIDYSKVSFSYPTRPNVSVLRGLDLIIEQGKSVALVGSSGCGKSTIMQLLQRLYDPRRGTVSVDGVDVRNVTLKSLRANFGLVSQEPVLFDRTVEENIAYGNNNRNVDKQEIIQAAKNANIHNFIVSLPQGYETRLGEKGTQLSGGQKQRMAIARALIRNPRILLLDEATSALDTESEKIVQEALDDAKQGRTCITIAHRLTTIQDSDVICVLHKGKVAEIGKHQELLNQKGIYYKLQMLQK